MGPWATAPDAAAKGNPAGRRAGSGRRLLNAIRQQDVGDTCVHGRDLVRFAPPPPRPRWLERTHVAELLAQLTPGSKTVVRLQLMHWTGMRPSQMGRWQPEDLRLDEPTPFVVVPRAKGGRLAAIAIRLAEPAGSVDRRSVSR